MIPDAPWRAGTHAPRNLWIEDGSGPEGRGRDVGRMDTPELAAHVVACVNARWEAHTSLAAAGDRPAVGEAFRAALMSAVPHQEWCTVVVYAGRGVQECQCARLRARVVDVLLPVIEAHWARMDPTADEIGGGHRE